MIKAQFLGRYLAIGIATSAVVVSVAMPAKAQSTSDVQLTFGGTTSETTSLKHHAKPANTPAARTRHPETSNIHSASPAASAASPFARKSTRYPGDLSYQGGNVVEYAQHHPIYLYSKSASCTSPSCWGRPATFLKNLGESDFIHVVDQYTGNSADNRYIVGKGFFADIGPSSPAAPFIDAQMASLAHSAALLTGAGYGHIYHIFLPPGQDECFDATGGTCYSPDVPSTFFFCAYHSSADFADGTHVVYTVEPFQNVIGCNEPPGTANGQLIDSMATTLSHETFETITDPDGTAWWNNGGNLSLNGQEIGDECVYFQFIGTTPYADDPTFRIAGKQYTVQSEYNNSKHACTVTP